MEHIQKKQPNEIVPSTMEFVKRLPTGESITSAEVLATDDTGADVSADILDGSPVIVGTSHVRARVKTGASGENYKLTFRATTSPSGYVLEEDVTLQVREE